MKPQDFTPQKAGRLIRALQGYEAFVPDPLPPEIELSWDLVRELSAADRALSELDGRGRTLPNPHLLINSFLGREAVLSSRIEGTQASLSDLFFFEAAGSPETGTSDVREVANYTRALRYGLQRVETLPVSLRLIREMHGFLMRGVRGQHQSIGDFRNVQNWIGTPNCTLMDARYVPPPPAEMEEALVP
jgi:Fic family protein